MTLLLPVTVPFDVRQLRYAIAAADHRSFHRAALALDIDQSTLSRNVLRLERVVGVKLFTRSRAGVAMTVAGVEFIRDARPILASADRLVATMRAAGQGRAGGLMIGHNSPISAGNLRATLFGWLAANPDVDLDGVEAEREALLAGLDSGAIDLAILSGEASYEGMRRAAFWSERILVALSVAHPLAERESVEWTDLRNETFRLSAADPGPEIRDMLLGRLAKSGARPNIRMHSASREGIMSVLGGGLGITITCEGSSGAHYPEVVYREVHGVHGQSRVGYSGYWRKENENPALRRFLAFVRSRYALAFDID